jgi:hypothetical protein
MDEGVGLGGNDVAPVKPRAGCGGLARVGHQLESRRGRFSLRPGSRARALFQFFHEAVMRLDAGLPLRVSNNVLFFH